MAQQPATYYRVEDDSDISGIVVLESTDDAVRVIENRGSEWCKPFWMPVGEFRANTHGDNVETVGKLSDDKFDAVLEKAQA